MKAQVWLGTLVLLTSAAHAAGSTDPAGAASSSAAALMRPWIRFYASFDRGLTADLAVGDARPVAAPKVSHAPGLLARGLLLSSGGGRLRYHARENIDLTLPGGISFWASPRSWVAAKPGRPGDYVRFVIVNGVGRSTFVIERDRRKVKWRLESLVVGFFDLVGGESYPLFLTDGPLWSRAEWHMIAVSWDATGFAASVDGSPLVRIPVPDGRVEESFGGSPAKAALTVGDDRSEETILDELAIYTRALTDDDVSRLYDTGRQHRSPGPR